ncbi:hypothetical protein LWI29_021409 [Acer saccharum]|uniref:40S ribosomal protein S7 n=1 Tax=Acer saccharum TaxID=4024 RepID=A0AA39W1N2_ACESA|nr:hypothetical protein LWI29_021409 [Acer saccharum]
MYTAKKKIQKDHDAEPTEFEETVAQALFDLENTNQELKSDLKDLYINQAIQMDVAGNRKAIVVYVPFRLRKAYDKDVILIATRRIVRPPKKGSAVQRPRTRTLTAVHDAILEDMFFQLRLLEEEKILAETVPYMWPWDRPMRVRHIYIGTACAEYVAHSHWTVSWPPGREGCA